MRWSAAFSHAARRSLRDQREAPELGALLGTEGHHAVIAAEHMPSFVLIRIAEQLREARERGELDGWAFIRRGSGNREERSCGLEKAALSRCHLGA